MKNYKVVSLIEFDDLEEKDHKKKGQEFNCTKERYLFLKAHKAVNLIGISKKTNNKQNISAK